MSQPRSKYFFNEHLQLHVIFQPSLKPLFVFKESDFGKAVIQNNVHSMFYVSIRAFVSLLCRRIRASQEDGTHSPRDVLENRQETFSDDRIKIPECPTKLIQKSTTKINGACTAPQRPSFANYTAPLSAILLLKILLMISSAVPFP